MAPKIVFADGMSSAAVLGALSAVAASAVVDCAPHPLVVWASLFQGPDVRLMHDQVHVVHASSCMFESPFHLIRLKAI